MTVCIFDVETERFRPGVMAPELVCLSWASPGEAPGILHADDPRTLPLVTSWLEGHDVIAGHHVPYDLAVLCAKWPHLTFLVFDKFDRAEITDTKLRQQLLDIAAGAFRGVLRKFEKEVEVQVCDVHGDTHFEKAGVCDIHGYLDDHDEDKDQDECKQACRIAGLVRLETRLVRGARWIPHNYNLDDLIFRASGRRLDKNTWRLRYGEFLHVPISEWPAGAVQYPIEDAIATLDVFMQQEVHAEYIPNQWRATENAWALQLTSIWGLRTHKPGVDKLEIETVGAIAEIEDGLRAAGLVRTVLNKRTGKPTKRDGTRNVKAARDLMVQVCAKLGKPLRLTEKGQVSLDSDACEASEYDLLEDYADLTSLKTTLSKDVPVLRAGIVYPVHTSYGLAASGRGTSSNPNVQNPKRGEKGSDGVHKPGFRECFVPREGKVYAQADFSGLELHTLAQVCITLFGHSHLAEVLNAGFDPHTAFAADILGIGYEEAVARKKDADVDNARQTAKVANFGFGGGLGAEKLVLYARKTYNVILTEERAKELKQQWLERWPEMREFFRHVSDLIDEETGEAQVVQLFSNRIRSGCRYTAACNTYFQGLGADAAKRAHYLVTRACYAEPESVLYGSRAVNQVHDETILETDDNARAHDVAMELARIMCLGANEYLPDVPARIEPLLARCWSKAAKPVFDANKRLVPWEPPTEAPRVVQVAVTARIVKELYA